nr:kelch repeat-containing protein [Hufsiella arboris]
MLILLAGGKANAQWIRKANEIRKRAECNNVIYRNKLYVFGGFGDNPIIEKTNEVYDIARNKWTQIAPFPAGKEITHNGIALVDDNVWIIGGRAVDAHGPASSQVIIYNITTNTWSDGPELINPETGQAFPMGAGGYALLGRTIHVFGGFGPTLCDDQAILHLTLDVDKYLADPAHVTWENKLAPMPVPRNHISYVTLGGKIYAFGGQFQHDCSALDQKYCHVYDPLTNTWTRLTDLPVVRSHAEAATFAVDGKIYMVAGQGVNNVTQNTVYQFTPEANNGKGSWTNLAALKLPASYLGLSAKLAGNQFLITNGARTVYSDERTETYSATIPRSNVRTLGFSVPCLSVKADSAGTLTGKNLLYVIQDSTQFTTTSNASWLTVSKNAGGMATLNGKDVEITINADSLPQGNYSGTITATAIPSGSKASFCVNLTVVKPLSGYSLTVNKNGSGIVTKSPDSVTYDGSTVLLTADAAAGWKFDKWTGDTSATTNPLTILMDRSKTLIANFKADSTTDSLVTNLVATTGKPYRIGTLAAGITYYTDRTYKITSVPSSLTGVPFLLTANDDKSNNSSSLLSFNLTKEATVFVAYDSRATVLPNWLNSWEKLPDKISVDDPKLVSFNLYGKKFSAGNVLIGGNLQSPAAGAQCQFVVIVRANSESSADSLISNIEPFTGNKYELAQLATGTTYYTDRNYKIGLVPVSLVGASFIKTPADDKYNNSAKLLTFDLSQDADVYVAYDPRATVLPAWLSGWQKLADQIGTDDPKMLRLNLYYKPMPMGQVSLGGNLQSPASGAMCAYFVIAKPQSATVITSAKYAAGKAFFQNQQEVKPLSEKVSNVPVLYPNPVKSNLKIVFKDSYKGISRIHLVDLDGNKREVASAFFKNTGSTLSIDIGSLSLKPGIYAIHVVSTDGRTDIMRVIVQ